MRNWDETLAFEIVSINEIHKYMNQDGTILVDVREPEDYQKGHIAGAVNIPYETLPEQYRYLQKFRRVLLYCDRGNQSMIAARDMAKEGIRGYELYGGIHAYKGVLVIE